MTTIFNSRITAIALLATMIIGCKKDAVTPEASSIKPSTNFIGVDISVFPEDASVDYNACVALGKSVGMSEVGLHLTWTALEIAPNTFNLNILDIANQYYPANNLSVDLNIDPIETNVLEVPSDLKTLAFDNPILINRFKTLLDSVKNHTKNLRISTLVIGSEHDVYLKTDAKKWEQYTTFYNASVDYAKTLWPGIKLASELTFNGLTEQNSLAQLLNTKSDYIGVSYYPLNDNYTLKSISTVATNITQLVALYPFEPICFFQYGYPSSPVCGSSDELQKQFITQTFESWDAYAQNIRLIDFTWLHDLSQQEVDKNCLYYGVSDPAFKEFLRTIGLRSWNAKGTDKPAFIELKHLATLRGYQVAM